MSIATDTISARIDTVRDDMCKLADTAIEQARDDRRHLGNLGVMRPLTADELARYDELGRTINDLTLLRDNLAHI